jgi:hypothetical protein
MSLRRTAAKRDLIENEIIQALLAAGCTVQRLSAKGVPDLLVGFVDPETGIPTNLLMECKSKGGKLTPDEIAWIDEWKGMVYIIWSIDDALRAVGRIE